MKLVHGLYQLMIDFRENKVQVLVAERPETFSCLIGELSGQIAGNEGGFVLGDDKEISLEKYGEIIVNPFCLEVNGRKNLNKLYQEMGKHFPGRIFYQGKCCKHRNRALSERYL